MRAIGGDRGVRGAGGARVAAIAAILATLSIPATASAYFELTEIGARGLSLGRAFAPIANDASAIYWNPAGLAGLDRPQILLTNYKPFLTPDLGLNFAGGVLPTRWGSFWAAWSRMGLRDVVSEDLVYIGGARAFDLGSGRALGVGGSLKLYRVGYSGEVATGGAPLDLGSETSFGGDLGVHFRITPRLQAGWVLRNLGTPGFDFVPGSGDTQLDVVSEGGLAYQWHPESKVSLGIVEGSESSFTPVLGAEMYFYDVFALRIGVGDLQFFGGVGIQSERWMLDTAFATHNTLGVSTMVSLIVLLGEDE